MQTVITSAEARKITGGRAPHVPVEYDQALAALQACITLDEAKYWSNKADALAAWAKIFHSNEAGRKAAQLKLHAFRRMGALAHELRPKKIDFSGSKPGAVSMIMEHGFNRTQANAARYLANLPQTKFDSLLNSPRPLSPATAMVRGQMRDPMWGKVRSLAMSLRSICRDTNATDCARSLIPSEVDIARNLVLELTGWLDEFESHLPRVQ
jgi:hypothetical protein